MIFGQISLFLLILLTVSIEGLHGSQLKMADRASVCAYPGLPSNANIRLLSSTVRPIQIDGDSPALDQSLQNLAAASDAFFPLGCRIQYTCQEGYVMIDQTDDRRQTVSRVCQSDGSWSNQLPVCKYNWAASKSTLQSATLWNYKANLAVDEDPATCSFTPRTAHQRWWQVHLLRPNDQPQKPNSSTEQLPADLLPSPDESSSKSPQLLIESVAIVMSAGSFQQFTVFVIELTAENKALYKPCAKFEGTISPMATNFSTPSTSARLRNETSARAGGPKLRDDGKIVFECNRGQGYTGQFVYIRDDRQEAEYFGLCEVQVFGRQPYSAMNGNACGEPEHVVGGRVAGVRSNHVLNRQTMTKIASAQTEQRIVERDTMFSSLSAQIEYTCAPDRRMRVREYTSSLLLRTHRLVSDNIILPSTADDNLLVVKCNQNGQWDRLPPICEEIYCGDPSEPDHGSIGSVVRSGTRLHAWSFNDTIRYTCDDGYILIGDLSRQCGRSGEWTGVMPECLRVSCDSIPPPDLRHGQVLLINGTDLGSIAVYHCVDDYSLVFIQNSNQTDNANLPQRPLSVTSDAFAVCSPLGQWSRQFDFECVFSTGYLSRSKSESRFEPVVYTHDQPADQDADSDDFNAERGDLVTRTPGRATWRLFVLVGVCCLLLMCVFVIVVFFTHRRLRRSLLLPRRHDNKSSTSSLMRDTTYTTSSDLSQRRTSMHSHSQTRRHQHNIMSATLTRTSALKGSPRFSNTTVSQACKSNKLDARARRWEAGGEFQQHRFSSLRLRTNPVADHFASCDVANGGGCGASEMVARQLPASATLSRRAFCTDQSQQHHVIMVSPLPMIEEQTLAPTTLAMDPSTNTSKHQTIANPNTQAQGGKSSCPDSSYFSSTSSTTSSVGSSTSSAASSTARFRSKELASKVGENMLASHQFGVDSPLGGGGHHWLNVRSSAASHRDQHPRADHIRLEPFTSRLVCGVDDDSRNSSILTVSTEVDSSNQNNDIDEDGGEVRLVESPVVGPPSLYRIKIHTPKRKAPANSNFFNNLGHRVQSHESQDTPLPDSTADVAVSLVRTGSQSTEETRSNSLIHLGLQDGGGELVDLNTMTSNNSQEPAYATIHKKRKQF